MLIAAFRAAFRRFTVRALFVELGALALMLTNRGTCQQLVHESPTTIADEPISRS